jgi:hypothetical protein
MPTLETHNRQLYLDLLKRVLGDFIYDLGAAAKDEKYPTMTWADTRTGRKHTLSTYADYKANGLLFPQQAHTMIGLKRLDNLQFCLEQILAQNTPGDLLEAGVWRGGACIFMRGLLKAYGETQRKIWVADSFVGFQASDLVNTNIDLEKTNYHSVSQAQVAEHFKAYDLLDEQVVFLPGFLDQSLPKAPIEALALLRLDVDFFNPTHEGLTWLYPRLSPGGFVIIDDYYAFEGCRQAVNTYRQAHQISEPLIRIDPCAVYWQKSKSNQGALAPGND